MKNLFVLITFFVLFTFPGYAAQETVAKQAYIIDTQTGQVLLNKNAQERMPTSSMSKVMTNYMVFDALKKGDITLDTTYRVSEKAWKMGGSKMFVEVGKDVRVEDLLRGVIIQSGNDATIVLAEGLAGTEDAFAKAMTRKAKQLGMKNSNFMNASGWPDDNHYSTAEDLAILAQALIRDFPEFYPLYAETEFEFSGIKQPNRNPLLYRGIGADGIKTGHTEIGGYGLMASGEKDGRRIIMVLNGMESEKERAEESAKLFTWALNSFENVRVFAKGQTVETAPVSMGKAETVALTVTEPVFFTLPKMARDELEVETSYPRPLIAPISKGQKVGTLTITIPGQAPLTYELVAAGSVEELGFFAKVLRRAQTSLGNLLTGNTN